MPVDPATYLVGPEDVLQITVWKEQTLSGTFPVRPDGMISMVLLGDVKAAGLTPLQLAANLTTQYKKYIQDPLVTVGVQAVNSKHVFLVGEVGHVGPIPLTPGMTPLQAIAVAGGLTPYAHQKRIYILRGPQGTQEKIRFNYKAALRGDNHQDIALQPNDTIVVP
jgi:polysaccharide export outer membrane protein